MNPIQTLLSGPMMLPTKESSAAVCIDAKVRLRAIQSALALLQVSGGEKTPKQELLSAKKERPGGQRTGRARQQIH